MSQSEIEKVALSYGDKDCLDANNPSYDCSKLRISKIERIGFEWYDTAVPYWDVTYVSDAGTDVFFGGEHISIRGKQLSVSDLSK